MKNYFTKEQLERLSVAEHHFYTAVKENFKRGTMREMNEMLADIYEQATGEQLNRNWNCSHCCLNNFKRIGEWYFESIKYWQDQEPVAKAEKEAEIPQAPELEGVQEMVEETMEILDLNPDGTEKVEKETEPAPAKAAPKKKVANKSTKKSTKSKK